MKKLLVGAWALSWAASVMAQGQVVFNNRVVGQVVTHVYWCNPINMGFVQTGNGPNDTSVGTTDWTGYTPLSGSGYTAQLWAAPQGAPLSALQPAFPTTTFRTGAAAGCVEGVTATLTNVNPAESATLVLRVWDNRCGTITNWNQAVGPFGGWVDHGESPSFSLPSFGGTLYPAPILRGLQSFNLATCLGPYFEGWTTQPTNQVVPEGGTATFIADARACPRPLYVWYHDGAIVGGDTDCGGTLQIINVQPADAGQYWAAAGVSTSAVATLTVVSRPTIERRAVPARPARLYRRVSVP